jgi:hypothetical protein
VLAASSWVYFAVFCAQAAFYGLADLGAWLDARERRTTSAYSSRMPMALSAGEGAH